MSRLAYACAALAGLAAAGCASMVEPAGMDAADAAPAAPARTYTMDEARALYGARCGMCHRGAGMAVGLLGRRLPPEQAALETREGLTADYVTTVVRMGVLNMPPLSRAEVSDPELAAIASYLAAGPYETE